MSLPDYKPLMLRQPKQQISATTSIYLPHEEMVEMKAEAKRLGDSFSHFLSRLWAAYRASPQHQRWLLVDYDKMEMTHGWDITPEELRKTIEFLQEQYDDFLIAHEIKTGYEIP